MAPDIWVRTWNPYEHRYRELLLSDYSKETLDETLSLLLTVVAKSLPDKKDKQLGLRKVLEFNETGKTSSKDFDQRVLNRITAFASFFPSGPMPEMPAIFSEGRPTRAAWQAERTWAYLVLQSLAVVKGETGFFRDIQSLLFLCAVHYLLPHLRSQGLHPEHDCLLNAMFSHTILVWQDMPAHEYFLQSLVADYLGNARARMELLRQSFLLTPPEDHSYLTKAQAFWCDLVEAGSPEQARWFLMNLARTSPPEHLPEISDMMSDLACIGNGKDAAR
jgi:hypothetical protein